MSYLILVPHFIFLNFFFVIITKTWSWMSLMSTWVKRLTYLSPEGFSWNAFRLMSNDLLRKGKIQEIAQPRKICSINRSKNLLSFLSKSFFLVGNFFHFTIYVSFGNEVVKTYIYRSSLTVTLIGSQGSYLCYWVTLDLTQVSLSTRL